MPGANSLTALGTILFVVGFSISFLFDRLAQETRQAAKISYTVFFIASVLFMLSFLFQFLHLPGAPVIGFSAVVVFIVYIFFFSQNEEGRKLKIRKDRQLVAILFTDIAGFTRIMGEDEDNALLALDTNRRVQKKWTRKFRGRWLKEMGDGAIAIFYTA